MSFRCIFRQFKNAIIDFKQKLKKIIEFKKKIHKMNFDYIDADMHSLDSLLSIINIKFEKLESRIKDLEEENKKLKEDVWKDEEMTRMKAEYEQMKADYYRGFPISKEEHEKIQEFIEKHRKKYRKKPGISKIHDMGAFYHYEFHPTGLGDIGEIVCSNGDRLTFKEIN